MDNYQICVDQVTKKFGEITAVNNLTLNVEQGRLLTLLGPSGCGKTTLLRMIAGFEEPTSGRIFIDGDDVTYLPPNKRPTNMMFQRYALFPHLSVFDNVAFGLRVKKVNEKEVIQRVERILALVQLQDFGKRQINQISGGQAQRVALARALVNEPKVLLLDEPLGALDLKIRQQMEVELKLIHAELGLTFIYVTHDQEEAMTVSDRIVIMSDGNIIQDGTPEQIYANPTNSFVAEFIGHSNLLSARVSNLQPLLLDFLGHSFTCRAPRDLKLGQEVKVLLRPEVLSLFADPASAPQPALAGKIIDATFKGPYIDYVVAISEKHIKVHYPIHEGVRPFTTGDKVFLAWLPENALILPS